MMSDDWCPENDGAWRAEQAALHRPEKRLRDRIEAREAENRKNLDRIEELEAHNRELALQVIASDGQAMEAYDAQKAAEAKLAEAVEAMKIAGEILRRNLGRQNEKLADIEPIIRGTLEQIGDSHA